MRLTVATLCSHVRSEGRWWSYEPYVREANRWGRMFDRLNVVAPTEDGPVPAGWAPYAADVEIGIYSFRHNRGRGFAQHRTSVLEVPRMAAQLLRARRASDALCLRAPSTIALVGLILAPLLGSRRIARYTGQWSRYPEEALSYRVQRRLLASRWWRSPTLVYSDSDTGPDWIHPTFNAVVERDVLPAEDAPLVCNDVPTVAFVGRLSRAKNAHVLLEALAPQELAWRLEVLGDGPERGNLEAKALELGIQERVVFRGATTFDEVLATYRRSDALVLASETEGWPKALVEGMAFGLACVGSDRGLVSSILRRERGWLVEPGSTPALESALREILPMSDGVLERRLAARAWARAYTLDDLDDHIRELLRESWETDLRPRETIPSHEVMA